MANLTLEQIQEINEQILSLCEKLHTFVNENEQDDFEEEWDEIENLKDALRNFSNDEWSY